MEIFDIVDEYGNPTGNTVERSEAHKKGIRHRTAHVWIARDNNGTWQVLLQKRSAVKESFPLCYDTSSAGHIKSGDEPLQSALRELEEELGISARESELCYIGTFSISYEREFHGKLFCDNEVPFVFLYSGAVDENSLVLQREELDSVKWFDIDYVINRKSNGDTAFCVPSDSLKLLKSHLDNLQ